MKIKAVIALLGLTIISGAYASSKRNFATLIGIEAAADKAKNTIMEKDNDTCKEVEKSLKKKFELERATKKPKKDPYAPMGSH